MERVRTIERYRGGGMGWDKGDKPVFTKIVEETRNLTFHRNHTKVCATPISVMGSFIVTMGLS